MGTQKTIGRRVDVSADISDYVYKYEEDYYAALKRGKNAKQSKEIAESNLKYKLGKDSPDVSLTDSVYDPETGMAAIAVKDSQTGETYISYAGTNPKADFWKDVGTDLDIAFSDSLALKKAGDAAVDFYDQVLRKHPDANITVSTGHSLGNFYSSRTAMERDIPYMFGYQGAPQFAVGDTAQEKLHSQLLSRGIVVGLEDFRAQAQQSRSEIDRVKGLMKAYSGYAVTFSTQGDVLTNATWKQSRKEIYLPGGEMAHAGASVLGFLTISRIDAQYLGKVVAVDSGTSHNMTLYRTNDDLMQYTRQIVLMSSTSVDVNGDHQDDFVLTQDYLTKQSLIPEFAKTQTGNNQTIKLDTDAMVVLKNNLITVKTQLEELSSQTERAITTNNDVIKNISNRKRNLKDAIKAELENVSLVQAIKNIDTAFLSLQDILPSVKTIMNYDTGEFKRKFDGWGVSGTYTWYDSASGNSFWDYGSVSKELDELVIASRILNNKLESEALLDGQMIDGKVIDVTTVTEIASKGVEAVDSFEQIIDDSTKGLGNRSGLYDGIPEAVGELLVVISQNIKTLIQCVQHLINVSDLIATTLSSTDTSLATGISSFDMSGISVPNVTVASSYDNFLQSSQVFDDMAVIEAFDNQVNDNAENLSSQMSTTFTNYFAIVKGGIETYNTSLSDMTDALFNIQRQFSDEIYYSKQLDAQYAQYLTEEQIAEYTKVKYYGTVETQISIASTIIAMASDSGSASIRNTDKQLTTAITTINTVLGMIGGFKEPFRIAMEDAFYGADGLLGVVKIQRLVGEVLVAMSTRFMEFQTNLSSQSGVAIGALSDKVDETVITMSYVSRMIADCFGD